MSRQSVSLLLTIAAIITLIVVCIRPPRTGHPVSPWMEARADGISSKKISTISTAPHAPTIVVFVLPSWPCSVEYEPYVQRLFEAYRGKAEFIEIVAGEQHEAEVWKQINASPFAVVADRDRKVALEFGAARSAYTALVLNGEIAKFWPGYSADMLRDLGTRISRVTNTPNFTIDLQGVPERLTSGCSLD